MAPRDADKPIEELGDAERRGRTSEQAAERGDERTPVGSTAPVIGEDDAAAAVAGEAEGRRGTDRRKLPAPSRRARARRKNTENLIGAFLLAILVGGAVVWLENGRCPGVLRAAFESATPLAVPIGVVVAGLIANADRTAKREEKIARGVMLAAWAAVASIALATGMVMTLNERGERSITERRCLIERRETVPARTAGVGEWVLVLRCSERMSPVRVDVDRRTWWAHEAGGTLTATVARGSLDYEWVLDTELGPPTRGFTSW